MYENYTYQSELHDIEKALAAVDQLIEGLRLDAATELRLSQQLWEVMESIEESLGVET